jgi:hypothetical protein
MKRSPMLGVGCLLVMVMSIATCEAMEPSPPQSTPMAPSEAWVKYESKEGEYEVLFPVQPLVMTPKLQSGATFVLAYAKSKDDKTTFSASFDNYTSNSADRYLEGVRRGMAARGELDKVELLKVDGKPAADYAYHQKKGDAVKYSRKLMIVDTNRVYQLVVGSLNEKPNEAEVKKFFDSFRLTK